MLSDGNQPVSSLLQDDLSWGISRSRARLALWCVVRGPGVSCNPLWIYGNDTAGMQSLKNAYLSHVQNVAGLSVINTSADNLCSEFLEAFKKDEEQLFFDDVLTVDVLVVDSLELLGKFSKIQQSNFLRMLELMCSVNKQVVLFSDQPVRNIRGLEYPNLLSRFDRALEVEF